jgi:SAM-dependent methyltransferase
VSAAPGLKGSAPQPDPGSRSRCLDAERRIRAYHADRTWQADVCAYSGLSEAELLSRDAAPEAADASSRTATAREIARHEEMARAEYKLALHRDWLKALAAAVRPGRPFHVLDYGCGASSFVHFALDWPEVHGTLAEAGEVMLPYMRWRSERRGDGRTRVVGLSARRSRYHGSARLRVDVSGVSGAFDAIVLADVLEHTLDPLRVLIHLLAHLRPGGIAFVNYPSEVDGDWHTPEAYFQRQACFLLLRSGCRDVGGHTWRRRPEPLPSAALALARCAEPWLRRASRRFARHIFQERGDSLVARIRELSGRELSVGDLLADV